MKYSPALLKNQAADCRHIHGAKLGSTDQIQSCERLWCGQLELPKTEAHVKQCPSPRHSEGESLRWELTLLY